MRSSVLFVARVRDAHFRDRVPEDIGPAVPGAIGRIDIGPGAPGETAAGGLVEGGGTLDDESAAVGRTPDESGADRGLDESGAVERGPNDMGPDRLAISAFSASSRDS